MSEVTGTIVGDRQGALLEAYEEPEGETTAAIAGFTVNHLCEAGERLGLGDLERVTVGGAAKAAILCVSGQAVLTVRVDARGPVTGIEKKIQAIVSPGGPR